MNDERFQRMVGSWLSDEDAAPPDSLQSARQVAARLPLVRQQSRWWPLPLLRRTPAPTRATDTTEYQPSPIPATNGHTPTVIGRTQSMLSPVKAITAGAIVAAVGGAFLIAQPFQQGSSVPGAETDTGPAESTPFTMRLVWYDQQLQDAEDVTEAGVNKSVGSCNAMGVAAPSDPRMDGDVMYCTSEHVYGEDRDADTNVGTATYRIVNDEGAWQGSHTGATWTDPASGEFVEATGNVVILSGEGAYDGLYAAMTTAPWSDIRGVIFEGAPPAGPILPSTE